MDEFLLEMSIALFAIGFFYSIAWAITKGWRELAESYQVLGIYTGKRYLFRSGSLAGANFGCLLIIGGNHQGRARGRS